MNFGKWIVVAFASFATIIITMVVVSMRQDVSLVAADYYQQEVKYQGRINEMANAKTAGAKVVRDSQQQSVFVQVPASDQVVAGEVLMFRPSDAALDRSYAFDAKGRLTIDTSMLKKGLWKLKIRWTVAGTSYFEEKTIVL